MTDSTLANLPGASTLDGTETLYAFQGGDKKVTGAQIKTLAQTGLTKASVGLGNVDNTADASKPVSTAQATAIAAKADASAVAANTSNIAANTATIATKEDIGSYAAGINTQTGTAYTLVAGDKGALIETNNASANTLTVPPNSSVAFALKTRIDIVQIGAGQTTIAAGGGVTIHSSSGKLKLTGQYSGATLIKRAADEWVLVGDISA